jgi:RHS repeat-associated protein
MTCWLSNRRLAAGVVVLFLFELSSTAFAAAGRTVGTYQVSPTGAATYTIPIWAPRGPDGLQPQIALTYNSQSGNGYLGVGWSLAGLSSIYRCTQTYAQDPAPDPVTLSMSDVFCMDGQRLRLTGGTYGDAGSTYQTEVANFANVTAEGSAGNGPDHFEVQGRDGRTYEYGNGGGSQVLANGTTTAWMWLLDKVTDRAGNTMTITYCTDDNSYCTASGATASGTAVPVTISWTPSSYGASTYNYTMNFAYSANVPQSSVYGYVGGTAYSNTSLLASIAVEYNSTTVKKYALSYGQSPTTSRDELSQVEECADAGETNCLAPTTFTYQSGSIGVSTSATSTSIPSGATDLQVHNDFTGDGLNDLAYCYGTTSETIYVLFASSSGYGSPVDTGIACDTPLYGDLTGSGQDGILVQNGSDWWYYTWNGSSFTGQNTGVSDSCTVYQCQYVLADVNGDGLPDLLSGDLTKTDTDGILAFTYNIYVRLNTTSGGSVSFSGSNPSWYSSGGPNEYQAVMISNTDVTSGTYSYGTLKALDFNGDGKDDIALETITPYGSGYAVDTYELISGASSFSPTLITSGSGSAYGATSFLDFNSDGCTDYAFNGVIYVSGCNGTVPQQISLAGANIIGAMDWNGDGYTDILVQNGSTIGVYLSEGEGVSSLQTTSIPYNSANIYFAFDANGDGLDDLGVDNGSTVSYYLHNGAGQKPDLLSSVTDGYGNYAKPTYVSMAQSVNSTYFETNDAEFPYQNYMEPLYLVSQTTFSDPSNPPNGTYQQSDFYSGAWINLQGRGFAGFSTHEIYDSRNGVYETWGYDRSFPYTGMLTSDVATQNNTSGETIFNRSYTLSDTELENTDYEWRYFPYVSSSTQKNYGVGGTENGDLIATKTASYSYDDYGNLTSASRTTTDNDVDSPYDGDSWTTTTTNTPDVDTDTWCLPLSSEVQISYTASDGSSSVMRTRDYTPDLTNCRYTAITTEPSSNSYEVTETLGYDDFGNINSDTVTGIGMTARQTTANWGTTGQFPMSVTGPTGATTQFNYDFSYGLVSSETDPNGLTTSWAYGDGFGRPTQETRPDSTYTTWSYALTTGGGLTKMMVTEVPHDTAGNAITTTYYYYDMLDRFLYRQDTLLDGSIDWAKLQYYDSLGRIVRTAFPYLVGSPAVGHIQYTYDVLNRVTEMQRPISASDGTVQTTTYQYDGDTEMITDPYGNTRTLIRDPNGWLRQSKDALGYAVILGYDAAGAKTSVTDSLGHTLWTGTYAYGIAPFLIGETNVDSGDSGAWGYSVDALGERTAWTDPEGQQFSETYDSLSRPLTRSEPDLFTQWTWGSSAADHNIGKLSSVCTGTGGSCSSSYYSESETYDNLGRLSQRAIAIPNHQTYTYGFQYNPTTGFLATLAYPGQQGVSLTVQYAYQHAYLDSITDTTDSPNVTLWTADAMNPAEQITQDTLGNGIVTTKAFDGVTQWLQSVESGVGGGAGIQNQSFLYDEMGNVTQRQDNNLGLTEDFFYDPDYRLSYSTLNGTQNLSLSYDAMGNITARSDVAGGASWTYDPTHIHEVTEAGSTAYQYVYNGDGDMKYRQGNYITWSSYNYPTVLRDSATGETVFLTYGPDRRPWMQETEEPGVTTQYTYHIGKLSDLIASGSSAELRYYIYAGNEPVAIDLRQLNGTNTLYYLLSDQEGSVADITNSSGAVVVGESFTAYGNRRNPTTWSGAPSSTDLTTIAGITRHGYTFQEALGNQMGLNDMVGRVQDAIIGRFLSPDPTLPDPTNPQSYDPFSYTVNNPLTYTDPTGFDPCSVGLTPGCEAPNLGQVIITPPPAPPPPSPLPPPPTVPPDIAPPPPPGGVPIVLPPNFPAKPSPSGPSPSQPAPKSCSKGQQCTCPKGQQCNQQQTPPQKPQSTPDNPYMCARFGTDCTACPNSNPQQIEETSTLLGADLGLIAGTLLAFSAPETTPIEAAHFAPYAAFTVGGAGAVGGFFFGAGLAAISETCP